jgi:hypothetical protein
MKPCVTFKSSTKLQKRNNLHPRFSRTFKTDETAEVACLYQNQVAVVTRELNFLKSKTHVEELLPPLSIFGTVHISAEKEISSCKSLTPLRSH